MRFLKLSRATGTIGINLDLVVEYLDNPERDEVTLKMPWTGGSYYPGNPRSERIELSGEDRRAFFDAIGR